jgi:hypothetical protein
MIKIRTGENELSILRKERKEGNTLKSKIIGEESDLMMFANNTTLTHLKTKIEPHFDNSKLQYL